MKPRRDDRLYADINRAVVGYEINVSDLGQVYRTAERAKTEGRDVIAAVRGLLDVIARRTDQWRSL